jgi:YggT family protein
VRSIIASLLGAYALIILIRSLLSWAPYRPGTPLGQVQRALARITDPVLDPIRRALPRSTMLDFSPMIAIGACYILIRLLG